MIFKKSLRSLLLLKTQKHGGYGSNKKVRPPGKHKSKSNQIYKSVKAKMVERRKIKMEALQINSDNKNSKCSEIETTAQ